MERKTWGPEIWDEKSKHHDDVGVILGTGFQRKDLDRNTARTLALADRLGLGDLQSGASVLDVGIGPSARFTIALAKRGFHLSGIDASAEALRRARANILNAGFEPDLIEADLSLFQTSKTFDAIFCVETFFHLPAHLSLGAFYSFNRALKPRGKALVQFAVLNEMTPLYLLKTLAYMTVFTILRPIFCWLGKRTFYVTVARHSDQEIRDIAGKTGFTILGEENGYYLFEKTGEPLVKIEAREAILT